MNDVHEVFSLSGICFPSLKNLFPCVTITTIITDTGIERRDSMYQFESRVRYSEVDSERHLTLPAVMDYLQDCCTFQSEDMNIGVEYLAEQEMEAAVIGVVTEKKEKLIVVNELEHRCLSPVNGDEIHKVL